MIQSQLFHMQTSTPFTAYGWVSIEQKKVTSCACCLHGAPIHQLALFSSFSPLKANIQGAMNTDPTDISQHIREAAKPPSKILFVSAKVFANVGVRLYCMISIINKMTGSKSLAPPV